MKIIDPHLHLFNLTQGDYYWLDSKNPPFWPDKYKINKSFDEKSLSLTEPLELAGFVHIEAGFNNDQAWQEIAYLEKTCLKPFCSIAAIDFLAPSNLFTNTLDKLLSYNSMVGVRHIIDDQDHSIFNDKQALVNFESLNQYGLIFEMRLPLSLTCHQNQDQPLTVLTKVIANSSNTRFIINHAGFPPTDTRSLEWQQWQNNLSILASHPNTVIKCSGWEMLDREYCEQWLSHCLSTCIDIFSLERVMLASNFPLCLFSHENYNNYWLSIINTDVMSQYNGQQKSALLYNNALKFYKLPFKSTVK